MSATRICCLSDNYGRGIDDWSWDDVNDLFEGKTSYLVYCLEHNPRHEDIKTVFRSEIPDEWAFSTDTIIKWLRMRG